MDYIGTSGGGSTIRIAEAAYAAQADGSSALLSASVSISSPSADRQITDAISEVDGSVFTGNDGVFDPVSLSATDPINFNVANGTVTVTAPQGSSLLSELPSPTSVRSDNNIPGSARWRHDRGWRELHPR